MKALEPYVAWIKITLLLAAGLALVWIGFQAGSARSQKKLLLLEASVANTVKEKKDKEIEIRTVTQTEYVDKVQWRTKYITVKEPELVYVSQPLAQCTLSDDAVRLHNEARDCSLHSDPTRCRVDIEVRTSATPATK